MVKYYAVLARKEKKSEHFIVFPLFYVLHAYNIVYRTRTFIYLLINSIRIDTLFLSSRTDRGHRSFVHGAGFVQSCEDQAEYSIAFSSVLMNLTVTFVEKTSLITTRELIGIP